MSEQVKKPIGIMPSAPTFWDTLAAIGTADTPAEPIRGFTLPWVMMHINLPNNTPAAVPNANATRPSATIFSVSQLRNASALVVAPTEVPSRITTMYIRALDAVSVNCLTTPDSLNRLPSISRYSSSGRHFHGGIWSILMEWRKAGLLRRNRKCQNR